jgi:hypothetical protein
VVQLRQAGEQTTRTQCENCHFQNAKYQNSEVHPALGVECIDCHMPRIVKSAVGDAEKFTGDIRSHLMAIDPDQVGQFTEDGSEALSHGLCLPPLPRGGWHGISEDRRRTDRKGNWLPRTAVSFLIFRPSTGSPDPSGSDTETGHRKVSGLSNSGIVATLFLDTSTWFDGGLT